MKRFGNGNVFSLQPTLSSSAATATGPRTKLNKRIYVLSLTVLVSLILPCIACTKPCALEMDKIPDIRGFRLGMTLDQLKKRFPHLPEPAVNKYGYSMVVIDKEDPPNPIPAIHRRSPVSGVFSESSVEETYVSGKYDNAFSGVERAYLEFVDAKLKKFRVVYANDVKWNSVDEYVQKVSEGFGTDASWKKVTEDHRNLNCSNGFFIHAGITTDSDNPRSAEKRPYVELWDFMGLFKATSRRMADENEQKKRESEKKNSFRP